MMRDHDVLIVGFGLAGAAVAWHLKWAGWSVAVVDRNDPAAASRVAAGLMTPITGQRFAVTDRFMEYRRKAVEFYGQVERLSNQHFLFTDGAVRIFLSQNDYSAYCRRRDTHLRDYVAPAGDLQAYDHTDGAFQMPLAARLHVNKYLHASRQYFDVASQDLHPSDDIQLSQCGIEIPRLALRAKVVIFCQGYAATGNPWFPGLTVNPVRGEILTVMIPDLAEQRTIHRGIWLAPHHQSLYTVGATYDRGVTDPVPTTAGRAVLTAGLTALLRCPFEIVEHAAGVRPVIPGHRPVIMSSPLSNRIWCLNGLASKGSLYAPTFAAQWVAAVESILR
jgi:glycine/D-amino acid oxidase-like deaminating enzyme